MNFVHLKDFMDRLTSWKIPGNSAVVYIGGEKVFSYQSGYENLEMKYPMKGDELFNIYSCSKVLTATAAMQLYEKGYFLLDDPVYEFIPEYKDMCVRSKNGEIVTAENHITLRHLFTMTSGLNYNYEPEIMKKAEIETNGKMNTLTVVKHLADKILDFQPGERFLYGVNHDILAAVVEVVSGMKFRDYVNENIFKPLEMNDSYYHIEGIENRIAQQYKYMTNDEQTIVEMQMTKDVDNEGKIVNIGKERGYVFGTEYDSGGAGIVTSVDDYAKFAFALANGGIGLNEKQIISKGTIDLMRTNQLSEKQMPSFSVRQNKGYGYGLGVRTMTDKALSGSNGLYGEFGWSGAAGGTVLIAPEKNLALFYTHHMVRPFEAYYQPRLRNVVYSCLD